MSQDRPDRPSVARFLAALRVKRNATIGLAVGTGFAAVVYLFFVVLAPGTTRDPSYYLVLAFTLALATAGTVALALTLRSAIRLSRDRD
ncbi:DUF7536 family protein [Salinilacihabitans rarus]|uniref:DUF7536 family protein n=1 Tax=Salinilacihabitans rarus TaxID=2961596 RepID=UPI0020C8373E|nr:hypothetical protein [Salinilacihabitans rarus]